MNPLIAEQVAALEQLKWFAGIVLRGELSEEARFHQVHPGTAHIHWLVGHVAASIDGIGMPTFGATGRLGEPFSKVFGFGAEPVPDRSQYPAWEAVAAALVRSIDDLADVLRGLTDQALAEPLPASSPFAKRFQRKAEMVPFLCLHTAYHLGQVSLLRRSQGLPSGMSLRS